MKFIALTGHISKQTFDGLYFTFQSSLGEALADNGVLDAPGTNSLQLLVQILKNLEQNSQPIRNSQKLLNFRSKLQVA